MKTHGQSSTRMYHRWITMLERCRNPKHHKWERYGARGITVSPEWTASFETFVRDMGPQPSPEHTVDRYPDPDGPYSKDNCRWATPMEQRHNRSAIQKPRKPWTHGRAGYTNHGCRCEVCVSANKLYMRGYKKPSTEAELTR